VQIAEELQPQISFFSIFQAFFFFFFFFFFYYYYYRSSLEQQRQLTESAATVF
jgi:hypothetical protein